MSPRILFPQLVAALLGLMVPGAVQAADVAQSVVQIRCSTENGIMKATGFVWPEPGLVVTALHAVAGCGKDSGVVYSEAAGRTTELDSIVAADLEGDLALVRLTDDMGLSPVETASAIARVQDEHFVWGYPLAAEQIIGLRIEFALGLSTGTTTLGRAFSSSDLTKLFRNQGYPSRDTEILRVTTTIQPGHSGAPIFDRDGRVVAIANGGLLGGWRGINWSIPAHVYLPDLPDSRDPIPGATSDQATLFSAYAVDEGKSVKLGDGGAEVAPAPVIEAKDELLSTGMIPLPLVLDALDIAGDEDLSWMIEDLDAILPRRVTWEAFRYNALQASESEFLVFVPERAQVSFDPTRGLVEARSIDGAVRQMTVSYSGEDFDEAVRSGSRLFFDRLRELGLSDVPAGIPEDDIDLQLEYVDYYDYFGDPESAPFVDFAVQVNGPEFSGRAIVVSQSFDDMTDADYVDYMMMELATFDLNSFWPLDPAIEDQLEFATYQGNFSPPPSSLDLVRRIPLADVAEEFIEAQDFDWKSDLSYLKSLLDDPAEFEALTFDVYEDSVTGATVAIPSGLDLEWRDDLGAVVTSSTRDGPQLAVAVQRAPSFRAATGSGVFTFLEHLSGYATWEDRAPSDCELTVWPDDREAECWDYFTGTDRNTGEFSDLYLALDIRDDVFLGTSVYIIGEEDSLTEDETITYLMMLIGAEYLSDFAAK